MKLNKKAILRIFIVLALCWSSFWFFKLGVPNDGLYDGTIMILIYPLYPYILVFGGYSMLLTHEKIKKFCNYWLKFFNSGFFNIFLLWWNTNL